MTMNVAPTRLYYLDEVASEAIFAPFHDPLLAKTLPFRFDAIGGTGCHIESYWDATHLRWQTCPSGRPAGVLELHTDIYLDHFDRLVACITFDPSIRLRFSVRLNDQWEDLDIEVSGGTTRQEITTAIGTGRLTGVRMTCFAQDEAAGLVRIHWFGVADSQRVETRLRYGRIHWDERWTGMIKPESEWGSIQFARCLLFGPEDLPKLRARCSIPAWTSQFALLKDRAESYLKRKPEDDLKDFLPWSDERYIREREKGRSPYFWEPLILGFVGLISEDQRMIRHALRYLMCMVHTRHWCQSAESRLTGSTWDQRCFLEEMAATSVSLLADWLDFALTDQSRALIRQSLWDKGLAIIERDTMKVEEVHHINQGAWFCRGRILAGLLLEQSWPCVGDYVDRTLAELKQVMDCYILEDGGSDEGLGYFCATMALALVGMTAFARARTCDMHILLPKQCEKSEAYFSTMSRVTPGKLLMDGDNSYDEPLFDAVPILAGVYPHSVYAKVLLNCLQKEKRVFTYYDHYDPVGLFGFILGPDFVESPQTIVPTFCNLPLCGHATSLRVEGSRSVRIHLSGAKANPSHSHLDRGAFTVELDSEPVLVDRGVVRYDHPACASMYHTRLHNVITPIREDGSHPDQAINQIAQIASGHGDRTTTSMSIDISHVWEQYMTSCRRTIRSYDLEHFEVIDKGELQAPGRIAFHLHSPWPFQIESDGICVGPESTQLRIFADWSADASQFEDQFDYKFSPVFHLVVVSSPVKEFCFTTKFVRSQAIAGSSLRT